MLKRLTIVSSVIVLALVLGGCTRCGFIWDDTPARSCRDGVPK